MYSPEIRPEQVKAPYQLKLKTGRKMTELVEEALAEYLKKHGMSSDQEQKIGGEHGRRTNQDVRECSGKPAG